MLKPSNPCYDQVGLYKKKTLDLPEPHWWSELELQRHFSGDTMECLSIKWWSCEERRALTPWDAKVLRPGHGPRISNGRSGFQGCASSFTSFVEASKRGPGGDSGSLSWSVGIKASSCRRWRPAKEPYEGKATTTEIKVGSSVMYFICGIVVGNQILMAEAGLI
jgi:hypothetical protein